MGSDSGYAAPSPGIRGFARSTRFSWPLAQMNEVVTLNYGKALTAGKRRPGKVPVYGTNGRTGWHDTPLAAGPTVVLGRKGMGNLGVEWCPGPFWVIDTAYYTAFDASRLIPKFFYYFNDYVGLNHLKDGTSNPSLTRDTFGRQFIPIPPLDEQRRIVAVLGALDDKIELNRKMNRTLEEMAQAIFKSWFIDFDGVPESELVESELGPIPKGWEVGALEDYLVLQRGFDLPKQKRMRGSVPIISSSGTSDYHNESRVSGPGVVTGRSGKIGDVYLVLEDFWPLNTTLWVKNYRRSTPLHAYHLLQSLQLARFSTGSAVPTLNRNHIHSLPLPLSPAQTIERYDELVGPLFERRRSNQEEIRALSQLRDTLLPKLISGEIRVPKSVTGEEQSL